MPPSFSHRHLFVIVISSPSPSLRHRNLFTAGAPPPSLHCCRPSLASLHWRPFSPPPFHHPPLCYHRPLDTATSISSPPPYLLFIYSSLPSPHRRRRRLFTAAAVPSLPPSLFAPPSLLAAVISLRCPCHSGRPFTATHMPPYIICFFVTPSPSCHHPTAVSSLPSSSPVVSSSPPSLQTSLPLSLHWRLFTYHSTSSASLQTYPPLLVRAPRTPHALD